jgi:hypothetical protein
VIGKRHSAWLSLALREELLPGIDWILTTWDGSRREQLRRSRELTLRERLRAIEEMADLSRRLEERRILRKAGPRAGRATGGSCS